jgi:hypothetical protein
MAQRLAVAADGGDAAGAHPSAPQQRERGSREGLRQLHIELAEFVERDAIGRVQNRGDPALEFGLEGRGAHGDDPQRRAIEIDEGRIDGVHAGSGHQAEVEAHVPPLASVSSP